MKSRPNADIFDVRWRSCRLKVQYCIPFSVFPRMDQPRIPCFRTKIDSNISGHGHTWKELETKIKIKIKTSTKCQHTILVGVENWWHWDTHLAHYSWIFLVDPFLANKMHAFKFGGVRRLFWDYRPNILRKCLMQIWSFSLEWEKQMTKFGSIAFWAYGAYSPKTV